MADQPISSTSSRILARHLLRLAQGWLEERCDRCRWVTAVDARGGFSVVVRGIRSLTVNLYQPRILGSRPAMDSVGLVARSGEARDLRKWASGPARTNHRDRRYLSCF
ncbi:hypothetical protein NL676_023590 [Syzygium grande]|nr:hypothetical protein NL676_023590 [Syzygium grande]